MFGFLLYMPNDRVPKSSIESAVVSLLCLGYICDISLYISLHMVIKVVGYPGTQNKQI